MTGVRRAIWRYRPQALLACVVAGLALAPVGAAAVAALALALAAVAAWAAAPQGSRADGDLLAPPGARARGCAALFAAQLVAAGALAGALRLDTIERPAAHAPPGTAIDTRAVLLERPRPGAFGAAAVVRLEAGPARGLRALVRFGPGTRPPRAPGTLVRLRGVVLRPRPAREFDYDAFLRSRGVLRQLRATEVVPLGRRGGPSGAVDRVRERAEAALAAGRAADSAALARGIVLGQDEAVDEAVREDFRRAGLAHLLAASGQNVMLLCALALPLLALAGAGHTTRAVSLLALIAVYVPLAGAGASIVRAGIMGAAGIVAMLAGRPASRLYALLLAAAATLAWNPRVVADPAWQLSFAAVAGIAFASGSLKRRIARRLPDGRAGRAVADALAVTIAATAATAPVAAHLFGAVSLAALPANLLALPAVAPVMWSGTIQAALGQLGSAGNAVAGLVGQVQDPLLAWIAGVAARLAEPAWAQPEVRLGIAGTVAAALALAAAALALRRLKEPPPEAPRLGTAAAVAGAGLVTALAAWVSAPAPAPENVRVDFLDVGQGDATLVRDGRGAAVLFDGGPPEAGITRTLRRLGVRRLDAVVATHMSRDHHGGLRDVLRRIPVRLLLDGGDGTTDPSYLAMLATARTRGVRRVRATAGVRLRAGGLSVRLLAPDARSRAGAGEDPNRRAVVALVAAGGLRVLLTADAESPSLLRLELPRAHALKVPHHGSADPGLSEVLARVRPRVAAIEVGAGNRYGHPAPSTLAALARAVPYVYRTDRHGSVSLELHGGRVVVRTARPRT